MIKVAFINPPHIDWSLANNFAYLMFQSHYKRHGKYNNKIEWIDAPYRFNQYRSIEDIYEEIKNADIFLFSSYVWNYDICDELAKYIKKI
jgi:multimeric flavodoxin WrbA